MEALSLTATLIEKKGASVLLQTAKAVVCNRMTGSTDLAGQGQSAKLHFGRSLQETRTEIIREALIAIKHIW